MNEESIKNQVILPYLQSIGAGIDELKFESPFSVRLGRNVYRIEKDTPSEMAHGRSDILCKRGDQNLFIIEVKADNVEITEDDVDQGISYARLVHPIAPFVIVTNGKTTRVIDTITKKNLSGIDINTQSVFWQGGCKLNAEEEIQQRYDALTRFIGYSTQNLIAFSRSQMNDRIGELRGSQNELNKKYIPELYLDRPEIKDLFQEFLESSSQCFTMVGEAGVGKTNYICALSESIIGDHVVLFFNVATLSGDIISSIKEDFNWIFSSNLDAPEILRRLYSLLDKRGKQKVCIFLDAIDEATSPSFVLDLNNFARRLKDFPDVRLCISCKTSEYNKFLFHQGDPTILYESIFRLKSIDERGGIRENNPYSVLIQRFNENELPKLETIYKKTFGFNGTLSGNVRDECHLGFMLRVVAEVYRNSQLPTVIDNIILINTYLEKKFDKVDAEISRNCLREIGSTLIESKPLPSSQKQRLLVDKIEESELRKRLCLNVTDKLPSGLFSYNILTRTEIDGLRYIGFYYSRIRDYAVAILALKLPSLTDDEFRKKIPLLFENSAGQSALSWYTSIANVSQRTILNEHYISNALIFLDEYVRIIETHFPKLKDRFEPRTQGKIGLIVTAIDGATWGSYGFRALTSQGEPKVLELKPEEALDFNLGVHVIYQKPTFAFHSKDTAAKNVRKQLMSMVEDGRLNEDNNFALALEKAISIIYNSPEPIGLLKRKEHTWLPLVDHVIPIRCDELERKIQIFYARQYFEDELIRENIKKGKIPVERMGDVISYTFNRTELDHNEIDRRALEAINSGKHFPNPNISGDVPPLSILSDALRVIKRHMEEIKEPLFPGPDIPSSEIKERIIKLGGEINWLPNIITVQYSDEQIKKYLEIFFSLFIQEYSVLVETCFPLLKNRFHLYSLLPVEIHVEAYTAELKCLNLNYGIKKSLTTTLITVELNPDISKIELTRKFNFSGNQMLSTVFQASYPVPLGVRGFWNIDRVKDMCVLRSWVYERIKSELRDILDSVS